uniref:Uncharacterized protein n=1 Tax=Anguilla anguilla TaxID=7936 RepID=A0A0E9SG84_ANGAN
MSKQLPLPHPPPPLPPHCSWP